MPLLETDAPPHAANVDTAEVTRELSIAPANVFVTVQPVEFVERSG